jgi:hypothetical protein
MLMILMLVAALVLGGSVVRLMLPVVPDCPRPVAFAISGFAMLGVLVFAVVTVLPLTIAEATTRDSEGITLIPLLVGSLVGIVAGAPFVGFSVLIAVLAGRRA